MKDLFEIKVECYAGYKAGEYPRRFYLDDFCFEIKEILDRWYQEENSNGFRKAIYFKVKASDNKIYILKNETDTGNWYLWIKGEYLSLKQ
jgi:hypothetical protein